MKRPARKPDGFYYIDGKKYPELFGSRKQVWEGGAYKTVGELTRDQLIYEPKSRRIISRVKHETADNRLQVAGYGTRKGKFGYVKTSKKIKLKKNITQKRKRR
jgi:hypothetical protein